MANPGTLPITLVTILLLVAPGYLAIRLFLRVAERNDTLDRTAKIVWSSAASLGSLFVLYVFSPVHFGWMAGVGETLTDGLGVVTGSELLGVSLSTGVLLYLGHLSVLAFLAALLGVADRVRGDDDRDRREPWRYAFDEAGDGWIEVFLENGPHIRGEFDPSAWDSSQKDLYLKNPRSLSDEDPVPLGQSMLVKSEWITGVVFSEDDPNRPQMELSDVSADDFPELVQALEAIDALDESLTEVDDGPHSEAQDDSEGSEESRDASRDENGDR